MKLSRITMALSIVITTGVYGVANAAIGLGFTPAALTPVVKIVTKMGTSGTQTAMKITEASSEAAASITSSSGDVNRAIMQSSVKAAMEGARMAKMQTQIELDFESELANKRIEASRAGRVGEVKEEVDYVLKFLNNPKNSKMNPTELISYSKANIDGNSIIVAPRTDKDGKCKGGKCGFKKPLDVSKMLTYYAPLCADAKRSKYKDDLKKKAAMATKIAAARDVKEMVSNTSSVATSSDRIRRDIGISCSPEMLKAGACGKIVHSKKEYEVDVLKNKIIPNGNVSALNLYSPTSIGGLGYIDMGGNYVSSIDKYMANALDSSSRGGADVPPIVDTYRNSSQLKSALSFIDNVINIEAVPNQSVGDRMKTKSAGFQNRFLSRIATLDLAKNVLGESVSKRRGRKLSTYSTANKKDFEKEYVDGAAYVDIERYDIQKGLDSFSAKNIRNMQEMTEKQMIVEMYKSQVKSNALLWERIKGAELHSLLLSSLVSGEVNTPENINYIGSIDD